MAGELARCAHLAECDACARRVRDLEGARSSLLLTLCQQGQRLLDSRREVQALRARLAAVRA
jgi:hypothetical protein